MSAQPLLHNWQRHRAAPVSHPSNSGSLSHLPRAESLSMSPASLMTFGPCSTPPLFCQGERTGGGFVSLVCESVRKKKIESRVCEIYIFFPHLSSRKRSAQNRHRLGSARRARVAQLGPEKPEQGSSQSHVSRGIVLTEPVQIAQSPADD